MILDFTFYWEKTWILYIYIRYVEIKLWTFQSSNINCFLAILGIKITYYLCCPICCPVWFLYLYLFSLLISIDLVIGKLKYMVFRHLQFEWNIVCVLYFIHDIINIVWIFLNSLKYCWHIKHHILITLNVWITIYIANFLRFLSRNN